MAVLTAVLVVNAGSSSLKLRVLDDGDSASRRKERELRFAVSPASATRDSGEVKRRSRAGLKAGTATPRP